MQYLNRYIENKILSRLVPGKVIVLLGARRVGKTVLLKRITELFNKEKLFLNADDYRTEAILVNKSAEEYRSLIGNKDLLLIDEAQKVNEIGRILKIIVDEMPHLSIMVTGS
ncbi:MAG: AAA family ATPase, partial [Bacteroidales bacterium]|nr:AAA family ATPase [Bacteroidales bacterium]